MKKVAGLGLILIMLTVVCGWAQTTSPALYRIRTKESSVTEKRFRKILGDNYDGQDQNHRDYDDDRKKNAVVSNSKMATNRRRTMAMVPDPIMPGLPT